MIEHAIISAVISGVITGAVGGITIIATIRVELRYLRQGQRDHENRIRALEFERRAHPRSRLGNGNG